MLVLAWFGLTLWQTLTPPPAYVQAGDRVVAEFRTYREHLDDFYKTLRSSVERDFPILLPELEEAPPQPVIYGYQLLPHIVENTPAEHNPVAKFSYSWPITRGYIDGEGIKLQRAEADMQQATRATGVAKSALMLSLISTYKNLLNNQRVIDQYIEYNRLWQRAIAEDRPRYDEMTKLYSLLQVADADTAGSIRQMLGQPLVPSSIGVVIDDESHHVVLHVPVYTDIQDDDFIGQVKEVIEDVWQAQDAVNSYSIQVEMRKISAIPLYVGKVPPNPGDHLDMKLHIAHFPSDGLILTTGAEMTNAVVKRYIALGPGDISRRTLAHEFGHLLGFPDGYIRGYKDLGDQGYEIQELTSVFDDIMSSPRDGAVSAAHFKLILETIKERVKPTLLPQ